MNPKTLEENLERLEKIVDSLGNDKLSLMESLKLYTEGVELSADCKKQLEEARQIVERGKENLFGE